MKFVILNTKIVGNVAKRGRVALRLEVIIPWQRALFVCFDESPSDLSTFLAWTPARVTRRVQPATLIRFC